MLFFSPQKMRFAVAGGALALLAAGWREAAAEVRDAVTELVRRAFVEWRVLSCFTGRMLLCPLQEPTPVRSRKGCSEALFSGDGCSIQYNSRDKPRTFDF